MHLVVHPWVIGKIMFNHLKSFLRQFESKSSRAARLIAIEPGGRARWTPRDYSALAREGYARNAIVYRAVRLIAESIGTLSFVLYEGAEERDTHQLLDLVSRPNPRQDGASLLEAVASHLLLAGNAYIEAVGPGNEDLQVRELYALRPDRMKLVPGSDGWPQAYEYSVAGSKMRFDQSAVLPPILHLTFFNPVDDHYGLSPLEAAAMAVDTHNAAACWNKALLDNAARPSGALVYDGGEGAVLSTLQYERLKKEFADHYQGHGNAGRPLVLEGGLDWRPMSLSPRIWIFSKQNTPPLGRLRWRSGCPQCFWQFLVTIHIRITRKPIACSGVKAFSHWPRGSPARSRIGWRPSLAKVSCLPPTLTGLRR